MNKEKLLELGLSEELANKVLEVFNGYIPKTRFDEVNEAKKKALEAIAERDKQLEDLKKSKGDLDALKTEISKLQETNKLAQEKYESDLNSLRINNAVDLALANAGARNAKAVKALLNLDNAKFENGDVVGLSEQIKALKNGENSFLFKSEEKPASAPIGMKQTEVINNDPSVKPQNEWNYVDWVNHLCNQK